MRSAHHKTIVGMFALTALILLGVLMVLFGGGRSLFDRTYDINVRFPQGVVGVQEGQSVTLYGKRVGQTTDVEFWDPVRPEDGVRVVVAIDETYDVPKASTVTVVSSIMGFGRPSISIDVQDPESPAKLSRDGTATLQGAMIPIRDQVLPPGVLETILRTADGITELAESLQPVAENLEKLIEPRTAEQVDIHQATANLVTVIDRFDSMLKHVNSLVGDPDAKANVKIVLDNAARMSEQGVTLITRLNALAGEGEQFTRDATRLVRKLTDSADALSSVLTRFDKAAAALDSKEGTMGSFLNDNRLYEEMLLSARRLTQALDELREVLDLAKKGQLKIKAF